MFCASCGAQVSDAASFCAQCGIRSGTPPAQGTAPAGPPLPLMIALGPLIGGLLGFLMRPSAFLVGQLPFEMVITRGSALSEMDQLLVRRGWNDFGEKLRQRPASSTRMRSRSTTSAQPRMAWPTWSWSSSRG